MRQKLKILIIGVTGMLGNSLFRFLSEFHDYEVYGSARTISKNQTILNLHSKKIILNINVENFIEISEILESIRPDIVINCVGIIKQVNESSDPLVAIPINAVFPHQLAKATSQIGARLIHFSTDCVFSGAKGMYNESDEPDARDIYGLSKYLGEVDYSNSITLRTSIIGHELSGKRSLVDWFLSQSNNTVNGYCNAVFSGLPTVEIGKIIKNFVIPFPRLTGLYHVSAEPINKFDLLNLISKIYKKSINIVPDNSVIINRSLDSTKFRLATGYSSKNWTELVNDMYRFK